MSRETSAATGNRPVWTQARQENQALSEWEFEARQTILRSSPLVLMVELTRNCNLACSMCRPRSPFNPEWNMSMALFRRISEELFDKAVIVDLRGSGESLLLRDFEAFVDLTVQSGALVRLVTNGQVNREIVWERLMSAHSIVGLSCDAASDELFAKLRARGRLENLKRSAKALVRYRKMYAVSPSNISLVVVASRDNLQELPDIVDLAAELEITRINLFPIQTELTSPRHLSGDIQGVRRMLDVVLERAKFACVDVQLGAALDVSLAFKTQLIRMCIHPWCYAYFSFEGRVGFCDHLIGNLDFTLGSIGDRSFSEVWNNERFQLLRQSHGRKQLPDCFNPCRWCAQQRYTDFEHLVYKSFEQRPISTCTCAQLYSDRPGEVFRRLQF